MAGVPIYTVDGEKIASLVRFMPDVKDGDVVLVKVGETFAMTEAERSNLADTISAALRHRARVVIVDESATLEVVDPREIRARRTT